MAKRILIVDDAAFMRMMIKDILTKNGYEIAAEAENGKIAIDKYKETAPDLTLLRYYNAGIGWNSGAVKELKRLTRLQMLLCVLRWDSKRWLLKQFSRELRILLLSPSRRKEFWRQLRRL